jgi:hypothetical protein
MGVAERSLYEQIIDIYQKIHPISHREYTQSKASGAGWWRLFAYLSRCRHTQARGSRERNEKLQGKISLELESRQDNAGLNPILVPKPSFFAMEGIESGEKAKSRLLRN